MIRYSVVLSLIGVGATLFNLFFAEIMSKLRIETTRIRMRDEGNFYAATISGVDMIESIKASGAENSFFEKWSGYAASSNDTEVRVEQQNRFLSQLSSLIQTLSNVFILTVGVWMIMENRFTAYHNSWRSHIGA